MPQSLADLKRFDAERPSLPFEHWMTFGAGAGLIASAFGRRRKGWQRTGLAALGLLLVARAASGRDGALARVAPLVDAGGHRRRAGAMPLHGADGADDDDPATLQPWLRPNGPAGDGR